MQQTWEAYYKAHNYFHLEPHESLQGFANECEKRGVFKVLDLGCGPGVDMLYLAEKGFDVTGVDFSPAAATNAEDLLQSKGFSSKVYVDNLFDRVTSFQSGEFQAIMAINSLEYTDVDTFSDAITQVARILGPKGLFLLVVSSSSSKVDVAVSEQIFFKEEDLTAQLVKRFNVLDFYQDESDCYVAILEKISHT